ncbi:MAG: HD domain-containing protein [Lachnospiraceae bacterium]|nr:HD domain-containing protein [Lachnospiraceae bacterium]
MLNYLVAHQLNIMMWLSGICGMTAVLLFFSNALSRKRKWILILMEMTALFLLSFDRSAYIYAGDTSTVGYYMIRISNFLVFFLTPMIVLNLNLYISDLILNEGGSKTLPLRVVFVNYTTVIGMILVAIYHRGGFYYYFDENNYYHRGPGFIFCYAVPVVCSIVQYTVVREFKQSFSKYIYRSVVQYIFLPIICGILQMFIANVSLANMSITLASFVLYVFTYIDINDKVERTFTDEMAELVKENRSSKRLLEQTALAFMNAVDSRDRYTEGRSELIARYSKKIAELEGKTEKECSEIYYAALFHNVGEITVPDSLLLKNGKLTEDEEKIVRNRYMSGSTILKNVSENPGLALAAKYSRERYDGSGYPEGLKGEDIPEVARIIEVAETYVDLISTTREHNPIPNQIVRDEFIKNAGIIYDPDFSRDMVSIIDSETEEGKHDHGASDVLLEETISCGKYREECSVGIRINSNKVRVSFKCEKRSETGDFSAPSLILFDSYDKRIHDNARSIEEYHYIEYGELWFDDHFILTDARAIKKTGENYVKGRDHLSIGEYLIHGSKYEDHVKLVLESLGGSYEYTIVLPDSSKAFYFALTGENCVLSDIKEEILEEETGEYEIERIEEVKSYIGRIESDIPNVQIDRPMSASSKGVEIEEKKQVMFHSMSLPGSNLVWHCPYIAIYYSKDGKLYGEDYREYAFIKLNGECNKEDEKIVNRFVMKKSSDFPGWDKWKEANRRGLEYTVYFNTRSKYITMSSENLGIYVENTTTLPKDAGKVYMCITGDQVAITDIRID